MTAETMIPEAFHNSPRFSGLLAALGSASGWRYYPAGEIVTTERILQSNY